MWCFPLMRSQTRPCPQHVRDLQYIREYFSHIVNSAVLISEWKKMPPIFKHVPLEEYLHLDQYIPRPLDEARLAELKALC
jgi:hypothetical protein